MGGTFRLKGISSAAQFASLATVLRVAVYTYVSLILEHELLSDSHVELRYPQSSIQPSLSVPLVERSSSTPNVQPKNKRESGGLWSYLSRKTEDLIHRAANVAPQLEGRHSLELPLAQKYHRHTSLPQRPVGDSQLGRRFSLLSSVSSRRSSEGDPNESLQMPYSTALKRVEAAADLLSTSPCLAVSAPSVLSDIAAQEKTSPKRRLAGDERVALTSLLGWQGKESGGRGMVGIAGFVRHQGYSVLYSEHIPHASLTSVSPTPSSSTPPTPTESSFLPRVPCGAHRRKWITYRYYSRGKRWDESLGETITRFCSFALEPCIHPDCHYIRAEHDMRWIHGGVRIIAVVTVPNEEGPSTEDSDTIHLWHTCARCGTESLKEVMHDGT